MAWITVIVLICLWFWSDHKSRTGYSRQYKLTQFYLTSLLLACESKSQLTKLLNTVYEYDYNNVPVSEFNDKWTALCEAAGVPVLTKPVARSGMECVSSEVIDMIVDNIFDNAVNKRYIKDIRDSNLT